MWSEGFFFKKIYFGIITLDGCTFPGLPDVERAGGAVCWFGLTR